MYWRTAMSYAQRFARLTGIRYQVRGYRLRDGAWRYRSEPVTGWPRRTTSRQKRG